MWEASASIDALLGARDACDETREACSVGVVAERGDIGRGVRGSLCWVEGFHAEGWGGDLSSWGNAVLGLIVMPIAGSWYRRSTPRYDRVGAVPVVPADLCHGM